MTAAPGPPRPDRLLRTIARAAAGAAVVAARGGVRLPRPVDRDLKVVVAELTAEAPDAVGLRLARPDGAPLPPWRPGAHLDVLLPSGRLRQYSLCGDPADRTAYRVAVRRIDAGQGGSLEVHGLLPGTRLVVRGPRNAFPFVVAPAYLFLAGGIGITPIAPMVRAAAARGADWRLVHTGRDLASLPLSERLAGLDPARVIRRADDVHGGVPTAAELLADLPAGAAVYCCGPPAMIDAVRRAVPDGHGFHAERFSPPPVRGGRPFTVRLGHGGPVVEVPADRSALAAVRDVVPDLAYSCQQGFCGTCHVPLLAGATEQDTSAPGRMALCVARARDATPLVVDLGRHVEPCGGSTSPPSSHKVP
ncbi:PDR/VanB family oxidoreductase [Pseudonocardia sp. TRM90224]|uniref:PDR/VanB family oxidoreductase n=1 Tax=Pseudonocardia sp. TRM90224 TaxID=2812678 RepID=UPI001E2A88A3|nr:PDR/VanB family oxidoreductase [Pseudonocardia sp. TRM90224]